MAQLSAYQRDILIRTALGEARGEGVDGMADVIQVIMNRAGSGQYPSDPARVALQPYQFSTWNKGEGGNNPQQFKKDSQEYKRAEQALDAVLSGDRPDYTGGALFYHTPAVNPGWASSVNRHGTVQRNGHVFYPNHPVPPAEIPNVVATQLDTRPTRITGASGSAPSNRATSQVPTNWFTPRLAPGNEDIYSYHIPDVTLASMAGGRGSLTPSIGQRDPVPLPRPRPVTASDIARAPGVTVGSAPTRTAPAQSLPPLPSSTLPAPRMLETSMQRAAEAQRPSLAAALAPVPSMTREQQRADNGQLRATPRQVAAGQGVTIATVPTVAPVAPMTREEQRADNGQFRPRASTPLPQTEIPGPNAAPKPEDRLAAGIYPAAPTAVLPAVPPIGVGVASQLDVLPSLPTLPISRPVARFPTPAALRPVSGFPSPISMRPAAPIRSRPIVGFPTPVAQRPASQAPLRISVQRSSSPAPLTREQQVAAILAQSRGPTAFGHGGSIDGALQPTGTIFGR
ncbi:cell wall hydrolase [Devosia honganensis]|uniref:Cell wall hydrolase n=1 Tax=Devosia honganensis TaxID=1610527 RepID=A0ABV7X5Y6_9HYPH